MQLDNIVIEGVREDGLIMGSGIDRSDGVHDRVITVMFDASREQFSLTWGSGLNRTDAPALQEGYTVSILCDNNAGGALTGVRNIMITSLMPSKAVPAKGKVLDVPTSFTMGDDSLRTVETTPVSAAPVAVDRPMPYRVQKQPTMIRKPNVGESKIVVNDGLVTGFELDEATYHRLLEHTHKNDVSFAADAINNLLDNEVDAVAIAKNIPTEILMDELLTRGCDMLNESKDRADEHAVAYAISDHLDSAATKLKRYMKMKADKPAEKK
jgi:hypothetical protein